jgi:hypothetical protein
MSTRAVIARATGHEGEFKGIYSHWDGYPTNLGKRLWKIVHDRGLTNALRFMIDQHPAGWSVAGEECYCHPKREREAEGPNPFTHKDVGKDSDIEWVYVFDEENNRLFVRDTGHDAEEIVDLAAPEPDWSHVECSEDLSRCHHYARVHGLAPKTCDLSTQTWLGRRELEFHDAVAFLIGGKRYKATGSGGNSDYLRSCARYQTNKPLPRNTWIATVVAGDGKRLELPVASIRDGKYAPYPGVQWILPGTKDNPKETVIGGAMS